jgi:hypothetical protein
MCIGMLAMDTGASLKIGKSRRFVKCLADMLAGTSTMNVRKSGQVTGQKPDMQAMEEEGGADDYMREDYDQYDVNDDDDVAMGLHPKPRVHKNNGLGRLMYEQSNELASPSGLVPTTRYEFPTSSLSGPDSNESAGEIPDTNNATLAQQTAAAAAAAVGGVGVGDEDGASSVFNLAFAAAAACQHLLTSSKHNRIKMSKDVRIVSLLVSMCAHAHEGGMHAACTLHVLTKDGRQCRKNLLMHQECVSSLVHGMMIGGEKQQEAACCALAVLCEPPEEDEEESHDDSQDVQEEGVVVSGDAHGDKSGVGGHGDDDDDDADDNKRTRPNDGNRNDASDTKKTAVVGVQNPNLNTGTDVVDRSEDQRGGQIVALTISEQEGAFPCLAHMVVSGTQTQATAATAILGKLLMTSGAFVKGMLAEMDGFLTKILKCVRAESDANLHGLMVRLL